MALTKKARRVTALSVEGAANLEPEIKQPEKTVVQPTPEPAALTVKEQKSIVTTTATALGITLQPADIKVIIKGADANVKSNADNYRAFAGLAIQQYCDRIRQHNQQQLQAIGNEFAESMNQVNREFEEGVKQTFRDWAEGVAEGNRQSAATLKLWEDQLSEGNFWD